MGDTMRKAQGGCHCGAVRFEVQFNTPPELLDCNCSMCSKTGYLHLIASADEFVLLQGREALSSYRFGTGKADHLFCSKCGIKSFYVPRSHPDGVSVNWRTLNDIDDVQPNIRPYDGKNWEQARAELG